MVFLVFFGCADHQSRYAWYSIAAIFLTSLSGDGVPFRDAKRVGNLEPVPAGIGIFFAFGR
jgi:hypothetical protein